MSTSDPKTSDPRPLGLEKAPQYRGVRYSYDETQVSTGLMASEFHPLKRASVEFDFIQLAGSTLPLWLATADTSAAGSPTLDFVSSDAAGVYQLATAATDEVEILTLYMGDGLSFDTTKNLVLFGRFKVDAAAIPWSADQRFVFGFASARDDTLDDVVRNVWFRMEGASANLLWESDDGTTDTNDQDTGVDLVDDTFVDVAIDMRDLSAVGFYVDGELVGEGSVPAMTGNVQFLMEIQKDAGTETDALQVDYVRVEFDR
jgi:hypothetical protein